MGAVGGLLGLNGGSGGTGFNMTPGTNAGQLQSAYSGTQNAMGQQQSLLDAIKSQGGLQNQSNVYGQLQNVVSGQGPNPAQAMLNQATGANVANQAALMAGQRGAGSNVGLMARQAAQTGAGLQQQAAGQGASMQAQQSLGALGQAGNMANTMAGNQINQTNANQQAQLAEQQALLGANSQYNSAQAGLAAEQMKGQQGLIGGLGNAIGAGAGLLKGATKLFADGGEVPQANGPRSMFAQNMHGPQMAKGGQVPAMVSPEEKYLKPQEAKAVAGGKVNPMSVGETIPGKAPVKGDSLKNDVVHKKLEVGGVVIPRSVMQSKNPAKGAADFVRAVMAKKGKKA